VVSTVALAATVAVAVGVVGVKGKSNSHSNTHNNITTTGKVTHAIRITVTPNITVQYASGRKEQTGSPESCVQYLHGSVSALNAWDWLRMQTQKEKSTIISNIFKCRYSNNNSNSNSNSNSNPLNIKH
jgi:hypothetical protein